MRQYIDELRGEESLSEETLAAITEGLDDIEHGRVIDVQEAHLAFTSYGWGRSVAVQNAQFAPGSSNPTQFTEMYSCTQAGQPNKKRLQVNESLLTYPYNTLTTTPTSATLQPVWKTHDPGPVLVCLLMMSFQFSGSFTRA